MKTLEIKKTPSGQYLYSVVDSFSGVVVQPQYGTSDERTTVAQARERFRFDDVRDMTECTVAMEGWNQKPAVVCMTKHAYDKATQRGGSASDRFMGRILEMAGVAVEDASGAPF